jgi:hypothetical protein
MCAAKKTGKKPVGKKPAGKKPRPGSGSRRSPWPVFLALLLPALLVGGYLYTQSHPNAAEELTATAGKFKTFFGNLFEGHDKAPVAGNTPATSPEDERERPVPVPVERRQQPASREPAAIPRQAVAAATSTIVPVTVRQAQELARLIFGGTIQASHSQPRAFWYDFEVRQTRKHYPFDSIPTRVSVATVALAGSFIKGTDGTVVFVKTVDANGAEWTNEYAGALFLSGTPTNPGKVLGASAMQAPRAVITRYEALDIQQDGVLELVLEVESEAPGGYLFRDLAVHAFSSGGTKALWSERTLDDGPGVPLEVARFKTVDFKDLDDDGVLDIAVTIGKRRYRIAKDFSRKLLSEDTVTTKTFRFSRGKYRLARK